MRIRHLLVPAVIAAILTPVLAADSKSESKSGIKKITEIEGISEYRLDNGLQVLLFPDPSKPTVTVNLTVFVGSRHEGYGEAGMAHLLEHMLFKGTPTHEHIPKLLQGRGANFNGTTWVDRTNYFETLPATADNLEFAIKLEADRMVHSNVKGEDLTSEMTVVRNEFERGENMPENVLSDKMMAAAYMWHNYGKSTIGNRADIERVPIESLKEFYKKYYQPDNAMVIVAGSFDKDKALELIGKYFGSIPKPDRKLPTTYTEEPPQDGEKLVTLRRVGEVAVVSALWHIPAGPHPDYEAVDVLENVLTNAPSGRLYKALVEQKKAASVSGAAFAWHDPGVLQVTAEVAQGNDPQTVLDAMLDEIEKVREQGVKADEVERAKQRLLKQRELSAAKSKDIAIELSEWAAQGDWRLYFLYRDRLEQVTADDVNRVAKAYLEPTNRTVGLYLPTEKPQRTEIPETPELAKMIDGYKGRETITAGEHFDVSPENIARRLKTEKIEGVEIALLPKKTRGEMVTLRLTLRYGAADSLKGMAKATEFLPVLMTRGTKKLSRQEIQDELDKLRAVIQAGGSPGEATFTVQTKRENLPKVLDLLRQILREPSLPESELDLLKQKELADLEQNLNEPQALAPKKVSRALNPYPKGDVRYVPTMREEIEMTKEVKIDDLRKLYNDFLSAQAGQMAVVGDFDTDATLSSLREALKDWSSKQKYERISRTGDVQTERSLERINTPDKANAVYFAGLAIPMRDDNPDYAAVTLGNYVLGAGALSSRLGDRVRQKEGLSYGVGSAFRSSAVDQRSTFSIYAIFNPTNVEKVVKAINEEIKLLLDKGVMKQELETAKEGYLQQRQVQRTDDANLARLLEENLYADRTMDFQKKLEDQVRDLTPEQVNKALREHFDPQKLVIVTAGDFQHSDKASQ